MQVTSASLLTALGDLTAAGKVFDHAALFLGVFTAITDKGPNTQLSDITLAPGTLATAVVLGAWGTPYLLTNGSPVVDAPPQVIKAASGADNCSVAGWYLASAASAGDLIAFGYFDTNYTISYPDSQVTEVVRLVLDEQGQWDASVVWNG